jgi:hypothetical protein
MMSKLYEKHKPNMETEKKTQNGGSLQPLVRLPEVTCGYCGGRGINDTGSDCQYCDLGKAEVPFDYIARSETHDWATNSASDPRWKGQFCAS